MAVLDPQANLSSIFLSNKRLQEIYENKNSGTTISESINPSIRKISDIKPVHIESINNYIGLIPGDLSLSLFEDKLSRSWENCLNRDKNAFVTTTSFFKIISEANQRSNADFNIINIGPNFGAINRAILIAADYVIVPMAVDLFSLQGLKSLGNRLDVWHSEWHERYTKNPEPALLLPSAKMKPLGYIVMQYGIKEKKRPKLAKEPQYGRIAIRPTIIRKNIRANCNSHQL